MNPLNFKQPKIAETITIVTHQLKNPLAVIKGYLESLRSGDCGTVNKLQKEYLQDALKNVEQMKKSIDMLLTVYKIEEKKFGINPKPLRLEKIITEVLSAFEQWVKALNCKIQFQKPKSLPPVKADPYWIRKIIENFISNAVKYSGGRGKVEISLTLNKKKKAIIFSCKDNGIGIPQSDIKKVFTKFYRSKQAIEIDPTGSGLGLYINKAIVELSGGKIWFSKNKNRGTTFYFSLPVAES